jgi:arylsulfatase A-like enzyme
VLGAAGRRRTKRWSGLAAAVALALLAQGCGEPRRPNALLVVIDTLRADFLPPYGGASETAPALAALARDGVVFERAVAPSSWTKTSMASLFTGRDPLEHGVLEVPGRLPGDLATLPQALWDAGYRTLGLNTNPWLRPQFGFDRGFERYETASMATAHEAAERALALLEPPSDRPTFLFVHFFDPHAPYAPARAYFSEPPVALPGHGTLSDDDLSRRWLRRDLDAPEAEARVRALYRAEIRQTDAGVAALLDGLRAKGFLDDAVVAVTADHGEAFREHGRTMHGADLYPEVLHVPLLFHAPGRLPAGVRIPERIGTVDVAPTLLALLGIASPASFSGRPLLPMKPGALAGRAVVSSVGRNDVIPDRELVAVTFGRHLFVRERTSGRAELYDLDADPGATRDLGGGAPEAAALAAQADRPRRSAPGDVQIAPETIEALKAVGYFQEP